MMKSTSIVICLLFSMFAHAKIDYSYLTKVKQNKLNYLKFASNLVKNKKYFTSIVFIKEYLAKGGKGNHKLLDSLVDDVINHVGVRQFEVLPISILNRVSSPVIHYIKARKYFRKNKLKRALKELNGTINKSHNVKPFALLLEGTILSMLNNHKNARYAFKECISKSKSNLSKSSSPRKIRQLKINLENCKAGIGRDFFTTGNYSKADLAYLDINKKSFIWPEILFEEAWNSFYLKNYNRTLGKLVTYKAPLLRFIFNPEIHILRALTYMELCLWNDVNIVVDGFFKKYENEDRLLERFLARHKKDYRYYYLLANSKMNNKKRGSKLLNLLLSKITKDPTFVELYDGLSEGKREYDQLKSQNNSKSARIIINILKDSILLQRNLIGAYVRKELHLAKRLLSKSFEGMSYIKLSILSKRKKDLYLGDLAKTRMRGDIKFLQRNDKQYFWSFNGEFWADELGDYVFTLKSECVN